MAGKKSINAAAVITEANRLLIEYMGYQNEIEFLAVQHKWGRLLALELNEHASLTRLTPEDEFTLFKVVESIREQLSRNYLIQDNNV